MSLNIAVQMDHVSSIGIAGDTTFALCLEAQARGHELFYYTPDRLAYNQGRVEARGWPLDATGGAYVFREEAAAPSAKDIPSMELINQTLLYAKELERIV